MSLSAFDEKSFGDSRTQFTAEDATVCKYSASLLGYFEDQFLHQMFAKHYRIVGGEKYSTAPRKPPIINRGYYARVTCINKIIKKFLDKTASSDRQIISLGSGFDTLALRLYHQDHTKLRVYEIDFNKIVTHKAEILRSDEELKSILAVDSDCDSFDGGVKTVRVIDGEECSIHKFGHLRLLGSDLRSSEVLSRLMIEAGVDPSLPTLILTECVMVYITQPFVEALCGIFSRTLSQACWLSYDMCNPLDVFGRTMLRNLTNAGFSVPGFTDYPTLSRQVERFTSTGWTEARSLTMLSAYDRMIDVEEKRRISAIEIFDEVEEWQLLMSHYALTLASLGSDLRSLLDELPGAITA